MVANDIQLKTKQLCNDIKTLELQIYFHYLGILSWQ